MEQEILAGIFAHQSLHDLPVSPLLYLRIPFRQDPDRPTTNSPSPAVLPTQVCPSAPLPNGSQGTPW